MWTTEPKPLHKVRVLQTIHTREGDWQTSVQGTVISVSSQPTGSWFAHGKNDKLWLRRLRLKRDDGEIVDLVLDGDTRVEVLNGAQNQADA